MPLVLTPIATENFATHANQNPINTNWKLFPTVPAPPPPLVVLGQILNGQYAGQDGSAGDIVYDGGISWPADQYSMGTLKTLNSQKGNAALFVRANPTTSQGYGFILATEQSSLVLPGGMGKPT